jgi:hypothetical protein
MLIYSLPQDQWGREEFGEYLRADASVVRRIINAL